VNTRLDPLKDSSTPAAKLFNWNVVKNALDAYGYRLKDDEKSLIVAGDQQLIVDLLANIRETTKRLGLSRPRLIRQMTSEKSVIRTVEPKGTRLSSIFTTCILNNVLKKRPLDILTLKVDKPIEEVTSCLEFLLVTLSRALKTEPKQVPKFVKARLPHSSQKAAST
jgi:hypothetical protein